LTGEQFLQRLRRTPPASAYLFLGPEAYQRGLCRRALIERTLSADEIENGLTRFDLDETPLAAVLDDARSFSLFATTRLIWISSAEAPLPRGRAVSETDEASGAAELARYLSKPTPGITLVFEASRYDFDGEDRAKLERVQKFYSAISEVIEFKSYTPEASRRLAEDLAREAGIQIGVRELGLLVEALGGEASRIATEIEKLRLFAGPGRKITADDIRQLAPNAQASTIFALVNALGRGDRKRALDSLDTLLREGEYLPLALTFLATQFRLALVAHEAGLQTAQQIQNHFTKQGIRIWRDRAEQINQTISAFSKERLGAAIERVSSADRALRDTRPDDRVVMEELVLNLTK
jgi:DNA polymerase-3 subunit delta